MMGLRRTIRTLLRDKGFTAVAVAMLTLGIGSTTAMFSVINTTLLRSPYPDPDRLFVIEELAPQLAAQSPVDGFPVNARHFDEWRSSCKACERIALLQTGGANLTGDGPPERLRIIGVTHEIFSVLGVSPQLGKPFTAADCEPGAASVIMLTDAFWRRRYGADPAIVGRVIQLASPVTVIGVLPPEFRFAGGDYLSTFAEFQALRPLQIRYAEIRPRGNHNYGAVVRLGENARPEQAVDEMNAAIAPFAEEFDFPMFVRLRPFRDAVMGSAKSALWMLLGAVGAVLLIVCVNLGNLLFVRAESRTRDAAIRRALGATRARLLRGMLAEGLALALVGGALGVGVAYWAVDAFVAASPIELPYLSDVHVDRAALIVALALSIVSGLLASLLPAARLAAASVQENLREGQATSISSRNRTRIREALVGFETALSTALLVIGVLLGASFFRLVGEEKGFETEKIVSLDLALNPPDYTGNQARTDFHDRLLARLAGLPGVISAGLTTKMPLEGATWIDSIRPDGDARPFEEQLSANFRFVSPDYWRTMGIRLLAGRVFEKSDRERDVAVVSKSVADGVWPGEDPIGKLFRGGPHDNGRKSAEVVGVVEDVATTGLGDKTSPIAYVPYWFGTPGYVSYAVRTQADARAFEPTLRAAVAAVDPNLPVANLRSVDEIVAASVAERRLQTSLAGAFAAVALFLTSLGVYGVVSYSVTRRTNEIGLRMALGADASRVLLLIFRQGMIPTVVGLACGIAGALAVGRYVRSMLFGVSTHEPAVLIAAAAVVAGVSALACYIPARRAAGVAPTQALRY